MSLGDHIISFIETRRHNKLVRRNDAIGDFYRAGGNRLLYDLPVSTGDRVIDAGGYEGEWSAKMMAYYGCEIDIFEPIFQFHSVCEKKFKANKLIHLHKAAIGGSERIAKFSLHDNGTSEFLSNDSSGLVDCKMVDVFDFVSNIRKEKIACLKLNIEGGEYEVLERLLETGAINRFRSLLIQFHRQPDDWQQRYDRIVKILKETHVREWGYSMVWEKWLLKSRT